MTVQFTELDQFSQFLDSCKDHPAELFARLGIDQETFDGCIMAGIPPTLYEPVAPVIPLHTEESLRQFTQSGLGACI